MVEIMSEPSSEVAQLQQNLIAFEVAKDRYQAIMDTADHIIIGLNADHTIFEWNKSAERFHGWPKEEALGKNYLEQFVLEEMQEKVAFEVNKVLEGLPSERFENPIITRQGIRIILWNMTRLVGADNQPYSIMAIGQDITTYKQAEKEARQSAAKYHEFLVAEQRRLRDLALLDRVRSALARELDLRKLFHIVVEGMAETFGYTLASLYLLEGDKLILQHQIGYDAVTREINIADGVHGKVVHTGQPILLENVNNYPAFWGDKAEVVSRISVPLFDQNVVVGTLNVESVEGVELTEADLALVMALSQHVSIAIERARLYTEVSRSEERFRIMFESAPIGLAITQIDGRFLQVNPAFCRVLGYSPTEILNMNVADISYAEDMALDRELHTELLQGKRDNYEMEKRYIAKDGRVLHTILQATQVKTADGHPLYTIGQIVDISERIQIEKDEREQRQLAETLSRIGLALSETLDLPSLLNMICRESVNLLQVHTALIWLVEGDEMVGFAAHGFGREKFIGLRRHKSDEASLAVRIVQNNRSEYVNNAQQSEQLDIKILQKYKCQAVLGVPLAKGSEVIGVLMIVDNQHPERFDTSDLKTALVLASHAAVAIENARLYHDLEKRVAERTYDLQTAIEELKKLDKLKTKLIDDISHELRTPTSNVLLYLDLLERGAEEKQARYQQVLRSEINRLAKLVEGIVRLSDVDMLRSEALFTAVDFSYLVKRAVESFQERAHEKGINLSLDVEDDLPRILGDQKQVDETLRHVLTNAINYTPYGQISIHAFQHQTDDEAVVCVEIRDTGMGIAQEDVPYIFERFYRGHGVSQLTFPGAGLGLFIAQEIVELHGGQLTVSSQVNEGSTFRIYLPIASS